MSLPTLSKSWQFSVNNAYSGGSSLATGQDVLFKIKTALKGFANRAWTCWGSSDGQGAGHFGNGDSNDRWASSANVIWNGAGNHSWIVLSQSGLGGNAAICFDCGTSGTGYYINYAISPSAGFGSAHGGTDGTASARPTASDEYTYTNVAFGPSNVGGSSGQLHVLQTTDGQCTRIAVYGSNSPLGIFLIEKAKNASSYWANPVMGLLIAGTGFSNVGADPGIMTVSAIITNANFVSRFGSAGVNLAGFSAGRNGSTIAEQMTFADEDTLEWVMSAVGLYVTTPGHRGLKGEQYDCWQGSPTRISTDQYPAAGSKLFAQIGDFIWPWNGTTFVGT